MTNVFTKKSILLLGFCLLFSSCLPKGGADWQAAPGVADRLIADTSFDLREPEVAGPETSASHPYAQLVIPDSAAFRKHPYGEWHYANGATLLGLLYLSDVAGRHDYGQHVKAWRDWNVAHIDAFRADYDQYRPLPTQNYRMFRKEMLDDTTAPCLPLVCLAQAGDSSPEADALIEEMADYVLHGQARLADGCLCRPEPEWTVWCDDAFMACTFLARYARLKQDPALMEECIRQLQLFYTHLHDAPTGLLWHGWHEGTDTHVGALWGRANGWYVWALSEVLDLADPDTEGYARLCEIEKDLAAHLIRYQTPEGLWHQVLDHPETYLETSCSALFCGMMARGVREARLPARYGRHVLRAWNGISSRIDPDKGTVSGICRSMAIQDSLEGYATRETADNDPRGLGAFFWAASEVALLQGPARRMSESERIIFRDESGNEVWQVSARDSALMPYFEVQAFTYDDRYCVFKSNRDGAWKLYSSRLADGRVEKISDRVVNGTYSIYTTGNEVVFAEGKVIYAVRVDTHGERVLFDATEKIPEPVISINALFTEDGDYTAVAAKGRDSSYIYRLRISTGEARKVFASATGFSHPMINPMHPELITLVPKPDLRTRYDLPREERARGWILNVDQGTVKPFVMSDPGYKATHETWSKDGERLYYFDKLHNRSAGDPNGGWEVSVVSIDKEGGDRTTHYTNSQYKLAHGILSADGKYFVCDADRPGHNPLFLLTMETGEARIVCWPNQLFQHDGNVQTDHVHPSFSRSGKYIAFTSDRNTPGYSQAYVLPLHKILSDHE